MPHAAPHQPGLFGNDPVAIADTALVAAYVHAGRTLDDLPYTPEFDAIYLQAGAGKSRWDN